MDKKAQKRKERERKAHLKVVKLREKMRKDRKEAYLKEKQEKEAHNIIHGKAIPFIRDPAKKAEKEAMMAEKAKTQLEKNMDILQALEQEYEREQLIRNQMNEKLESDGHKTLKEKMDALHKRALQIEGKSDEFLNKT